MLLYCLFYLYVRLIPENLAKIVKLDDKTDKEFSFCLYDYNAHVGFYTMSMI